MQLMEKHENVYTDISALSKEVLFGKMNLMEKPIQRIGDDRILFGSDYPVVDGYSMIDSAKTIDESSINGKHKIMGENAKNLLKI